MKRLRLRSRIKRILQGHSKGLTLVELVIAMAVIGILAVAFLGGLSNSILILSVAKTHATAESLAYTQMEHVKSLPYAGEYEEDIPLDYQVKGYSANITATDIAEDVETGQMILQKIQVTIGYSILRYNTDTGGYQRVPQSVMLEGYVYKVRQEDET